jgi:hypothetical protein
MPENSQPERINTLRLENFVSEENNVSDLLSGMSNLKTLDLTKSDIGDVLSLDKTLSLRNLAVLRMTEIQKNSLEEEHFFKYVDMENLEKLDWMQGRYVLTI